MDYPFAVDNGCYAVWSAGKPWDKNRFLKILNKCVEVQATPRWIVVPDVVADAEATFLRWGKWVKKLTPYGFPLALAVQDGMTPEVVKKLERQPDVIFVGGTTGWKWRSLPWWTSHFPRVHVGRANSEKHLWAVERAGTESSDGSGWFWKQKQTDGHTQSYHQLMRYLRDSSSGIKWRSITGKFLTGRRF